jgi:hypothetical protein
MFVLQSRIIPAIFVAVVLFTLTTHLDRDRNSGPQFEAECARLVQSEPGTRGRGPIILINERGGPASMREDCHPEPPHIAEQLPRFEGFKIRPIPTCTLQLVQSVYIRYWPRDPSQA